jgi:hypothetical protein
MNLKNVSLKILSVVMTLVMLLGVCAPTISALDNDGHEGHVHSTDSTEGTTGNESGKDPLVYVSLGDSTTNGYGLDDMR